MRNKKVTFGWDLCYTCNFRCPYCGVWVKKSDRDLVLTPAEWLGIWKRIEERYGECHINMSGGEPSTYPGFIEMVRLLSDIHELEICTNLTFDIDRLLEFADPARITVAPTFHSLFIDFEEFFGRVKKVRAFLPHDQVYCVGYAGQVDDMEFYRKRFGELGVVVVPLPLIGDDEQFRNTEEEKKRLEDNSPYKGYEKLEYQTQRKKPAGRLCNAGHLYAHLYADGSVSRCSRDDDIIGNIMEDGFALLDGPRDCRQEKCPLESQWLVEE